MVKFISMKFNINVKDMSNEVDMWENITHFKHDDEYFEFVRNDGMIYKIDFNMIKNINIEVNNEKNI